MHSALKRAIDTLKLAHPMQNQLSAYHILAFNESIPTVLSNKKLQSRKWLCSLIRLNASFYFNPCQTRNRIRMGRMIWK